MKMLLSILAFMLLALQMKSQAGQVTGQVSYRSSQHTYVRFVNTRGIEKGDTLFVQEGSKLKPALIVQNTSSTSCLCIPLNGDEYPEGHLIIAMVKAEKKDEKDTIQVLPPVQEKPFPHAGIRPVRIQSVNGSISAASYSRFTNEGRGNQRFRYRLNANASNISGSKFSARSQVMYSHNTRNISESSSFRNDGLKVYDLWLRYDIDSTSFLKLGRQINSRMTSTGPFDGITAEKTFRMLSVGISGGTTPDYDKFGFNPELMQFGGYLGYDFTGRVSASSTSLALVQHTISGRTDRRYIYFRQAASLGRRFNLFGSLEADLYDPAGNSGTFTSGYLNLTWRASGRFSINGSYDARRNPLWHETYRTALDSIIDRELRQNFRIGTDFRISGSITAGIRSSLRFMPSDLSQSLNISGYLTLKNQCCPTLRATLSGNYLQTSFIQGFNSGITLRQGTGRLQAGLGYNFYDYTISEYQNHTVRHSSHIDLSWQLPAGINFIADYEFSYEAASMFHQVFILLTKRF